MMCNKDCEIIHIPGTLPLSPGHQHTVNVYASEIEPKLANTIVRRLNQIEPLENLRHVKRVRKRCLEGGATQLFVILCLASEKDGELDNMPTDVLELIHTYQLNAFVTQVSKYTATSKEEWEEQCKLWPTSFHPPTYNIEGIGGFSDDDSRTVYNFMELALQLTNSANDQICNAAVIVDPSLNKVIATARDEICFWNPALNRNGTGKHMSVESVDSNVVNGFSTYLHLQSNRSASHQKGVSFSASCSNPWQWSHIQSVPPSSTYWHPLRHAAMVAIERSAARDRHLFPDSGKECEHSCEMDVLDIVDSPAINQETKRDEIANDGSGAIKSSRPYLCTGYDIYVAWEPCIMCAMALVHQRIRRIFYVFPNLNTGALGSVHRLQGQKSLNHHYAVFRVVLPQ